MTKNGLPDMVIVAETIQGRELIVILKEKKGLKAFSLWTGPASNGMHLRCESAQVSFYWDKSQFKEVSTGD